MSAGRSIAALVTAIAATAAPVAVAGPPPRIPDGAYRARVPESSLRSAGLSPRSARCNAGIQTLVFEGGRWTNRTVNACHPPDCSGDLSYSGSRVTLTTDDGLQCGSVAGFRLFSARWSDAHGTLRFSAIEPDSPFSRAAWGGQPWTKIG